MSILTRAKAINQKELAVQREENRRADEEAQENRRLEKRIKSEVRRVVSELNGKRTPRGKLAVTKGERADAICNVYANPSTDPEDSEFLFSIDYAWWSYEFRGSDESPIQDISCVGISITFQKLNSRWNEESQGETKISFGNYEFKKNLKELKDWLVDYMAEVLKG